MSSFCFAQNPPKPNQDLATQFTVIPLPQNWIPLPATASPAISLAPKTSQCSVPLLSVKPPDNVQFATPQIHPQADKYTMIQAIVPAPSCDSIPR